MKDNFDRALRVLYVEFDTPADRFLSDSRLADRFLVRLNEVIGDSIDRETAFNRLLNLRKQGKLPRLRR